MKQLRPLLAAALILWGLAIPLAVSAAGIEHISPPPHSRLCGRARRSGSPSRSPPVRIPTV